MTSLNTLTGIDGEHTVGGTEVARLKLWDVNPTLANTNEWGDSDSGGYTNRSRGRKDCTFNTEGVYDTTDEVWDLFEEGDNAASILKMNDSLQWSFPRSLCMDFSLAVNVDTEEVIGWSASWGADGIYYKPGQS